MLFSQLDDFDQDFFIDDAMSNEKQIVMVNSGPAEREITANNKNSFPPTNENTVEVQTLGRWFTFRIEKEMAEIVETVEDRNPEAVLISIEFIFTPRIDFEVRSLIASSGRDAASDTEDSERGSVQGSLPLLKLYPAEKKHIS